MLPTTKNEAPRFEEANIEVRVIIWTGQVTEDFLLQSTNFESYFSAARRHAAGMTNFGAIKTYLLAKKYSPVAIVHFTDGYIDISESMMFRDKGCKNAIVIPEGLKSSLDVFNKYFDEVIPIVIYETETN